MDLKIRDVEPATIKKLDELAKEKGVSRQQYLKRHLESFAVNGLHSDIIDRYEKQMDVNNMLLEKTATALDEMTLTFARLMFDE